MFPDERTAVVALVNMDATGAAGQISSRLATLLFASGGESVSETAGRKSLGPLAKPDRFTWVRVDR